MGDRYELNILCSYCNSLNQEVWYAPTCNCDTFKCEKCGKDNFITSNLKSKKMEDIDLDDVKDGFLGATMGMLSDEEIDKLCKRRLEELNNNAKKSLKGG